MPSDPKRDAIPEAIKAKERAALERIITRPEKDTAAGPQALSDEELDAIRSRCEAATTGENSGTKREQPIVTELREAAAEMTRLADAIQGTFDRLESEVDTLAHKALEAYTARYYGKTSKLERMKKALGAIYE